MYLTGACGFSGVPPGAELQVLAMFVIVHNYRSVGRLALITITPQAGKASTVAKVCRA